MKDIKKISPASDPRIVEIWKKVVDVQMHFNDIEMRIRNFALSVVLAVFAAYGFLLSHVVALTIGTVKVHLYAVVPLMGSIAVYLFFFMDFYWYHRLLLGAVKQGIAIEKRHAENFPELSITEMIGSTSPIRPQGFLRLLALMFVRNDPRFTEEGKLHSDAKIKLFYSTIIWFLILLFIASILANGVEVEEMNIISWFAKTISNCISSAATI